MIRMILEIMPYIERVESHAKIGRPKGVIEKCG
jgi:hypothetical protein